MIVRTALPPELPLIGDITAAAYLADALIPAELDYVHQLRDARGRAEDAELWVAVDNAELLGTVTWCPEGSRYRELSGPGEGEFRMLAVTPRARRRGAARALVQQCLELSRAAGHRRMVICSQPSSVAAHALYQSLGFVREPTLDWEPAPGIELLGLSLELGPGRPQVDP